jgi:uncharacterized glyoxalase superfamily protein PhnB
MMPERVVPMIHVPDVNATAQWYASIGFEIRSMNRECDHGEIDWALLRLGQSEIMLSLGGHPSSAPRREFDLYTHVDDVDDLRRRLNGKAEIVEDLHNTFYGMREFIIRDCNGFWITFGQPATREPR